PATLLTRCLDAPYLFALDGGNSTSWGKGVARIGFGPRAVLRVAADASATLVEDGRSRSWQGDPFALLDRFCAEYGEASEAADPEGNGIVTALSYDLRCCIERLPPRRLVPPVLLHAAAYDWLLIYDYVDQKYRLSSTSRSSHQLNDIAERLLAYARRPARESLSQPICIRPRWNSERYEAAVRKVLDYVAAGDVYQVNLAQEFVGAGQVDATRLFATMLESNAVPYAAYVDTGDCRLVSNSPECFFTLTGSTLSTYPIKGTRQRGADPTDDMKQLAALRSDEKERAEHIMIVDLERNDLGRICRTGTVHVDELAQVHTFPSLHHLISTIRGELPAGTPLSMVLRATFPGGSITGAPKLRAMEIIDEIEATSRGFYTGSIGFLSASGEATFNIAIRTAVVTADGVSYHSGGGIVADSQPQREHDEILLKARPFLDAVASSAE
ncbi:MAG TPA: aminodeoxychorismate synthase component I, partial [Candidatus Acidoferrales bacterium]|nr:aminodeoxychorismate synthase component I [Candidatus Acidoferrales bacterium]